MGAFLGITDVRTAHSAAFQSLCAASPKRKTAAKEALRLDKLEAYRDFLQRPEAYVSWVPVDAASDSEEEEASGSSVSRSGRLVLISRAVPAARRSWRMSPH